MFTLAKGTRESCLHKNRVIQQQCNKLGKPPWAAWRLQLSRDAAVEAEEGSWRWLRPRGKARELHSLYASALRPAAAQSVLRLLNF